MNGFFFFLSLNIVYLVYFIDYRHHGGGCPVIRRWRTSTMRCWPWRSLNPPLPDPATPWKRGPANSRRKIPPPQNTARNQPTQVLHREKESCTLDIKVQILVLQHVESHILTVYEGLNYFHAWFLCFKDILGRNSNCRGLSIFCTFVIRSLQKQISLNQYSFPKRRRFAPRNTAYFTMI